MLFFTGVPARGNATPNPQNLLIFWDTWHTASRITAIGLGPAVTPVISFKTSFKLLFLSANARTTESAKHIGRRNTIPTQLQLHIPRAVTSRHATRAARKRMRHHR